MAEDWHIHMVLDGVDWRRAVDAHRIRPDDGLIRARLTEYHDRGYTCLRDGGDRWGVCLRAAALAPEYGIDYAAPAFPIYRSGRYGGFIGRGFDDLAGYLALIRQARREGGSFVKIMISGLMDFNCCGRLTCPSLAPEEIRELVHIAHEEGFPVMAHANGAETVRAAAEAGVDSVEHGAYLDRPALEAMATAGTVWTPTLVTIANLLGTGRYPEEQVRRILTAAEECVREAATLGVPLAAGSDAGAYRVRHARGGGQELALLRRILGPVSEASLERGHILLRQRFLQRKKDLAPG